MGNVEYVADDNLKLTVPLGQFHKEEIAIDIQGNVISLTAQKNMGAKGYKNIQSYSQRFQLPATVMMDCVQVNFAQDGTALIIEAPYKECWLNLPEIPVHPKVCKIIKATGK